MAESTLEGNGLINNGDGITIAYVFKTIETTFFATTYALQNRVNEVRLYRKNYLSAFLSNLLDYVHIIPFLVHSKFFLKLIF